MKISYRIINDRGAWIASRPWHVESNIGNGWGRVAVCKTKEDAEVHIRLLKEPEYSEDALGLGELNA